MVGKIWRRQNEAKRALGGQRARASRRPNQGKKGLSIMIPKILLHSQVPLISTNRESERTGWGRDRGHDRSSFVFWSC